MILHILPIVVLGMLTLIFSEGVAIAIFCVAILLCFASVLMETPDE